MKVSLIINKIVLTNLQFLSSVIFLSLLSGCTGNPEKNEVKMFFLKIASEINDVSSFEKDKYFSDQGWDTFSRNFNSTVEFKSFVEFLSEKEIIKIHRIEESRFRILLEGDKGYENEIGLIFLEENGIIKMDKYLAGK